MKWPWTKRSKPARGNVFNVRGFAAAEVDRLLAGWRWDGGFTAQEITSQLALMRARSREMAKNNPLMKRWISLAAINIVGEGFALKSTPHDGEPGAKSYRLDDAAAKLIETHYWRWGNYRDPATRTTWCDATGRKSLAEIDRLCVKTWLRDGEYFVWLLPAANPYGLTLRVLRPDACDHTYNRDLQDGRVVRCGVEMDKATGRPTAYYMHTEPEWSYVVGPTGPLARIPAEQIIHGFTQEDEDQPRGVPGGHASLVKLKMIEEYDRAELTAARDEACTNSSYFAPLGQEDQIKDLTTEENKDAAQALMQAKEPGQSEVLPMGWKRELHTPNHPNREVTAFKATMAKDVAGGFGVEYSNFANDWAGVSFSSVRVGTISERDMYIVAQSDMIGQKKTPEFLAWLRSFLAYSVSGSLPASKFTKFAEHEFRGRRWMWVDPMKDMNAAKMAVENNWKTNTDVAADLGGDYADNLEVAKREQEARKSAGIADLHRAQGKLRLWWQLRNEPMKLKSKPEAKRDEPDLMIRAAVVEFRAAEGNAPASVRMSVSSEEPVQTVAYVNDMWQRVYEVLDHGPGCVDMSRCKDGLVILDRHYGDQIGLMACELKDKKLGGAVQFCTGERAQEIAADAAKGLRRNVSVGYTVAPESYRIEGEKDGIPVVRATLWMPYEASFEPVPADTTVGVNRAAQTTPAPKPDAGDKETRAMKPEEMAKLFARAAEFGIDAARVSELIAAGKGAAELDALIVEKQRTEIVEIKTRKPDAPVIPNQPVVLGGDKGTERKIVRQYSLANVCRALMGHQVDVGFENEITQEVRRNSYRGQTQGRFTVPYAVLMARATELTESGTSSYSVGTNLLAGEFIDVLRPYSILPALGVRFMSGLVGNVAIPKMTAAGAGYWVAETVDITRLAATLDQVTLSPHTVGAACDISYLLNMQSTPSAEAMVRDDIVKSISTKIEAAVFATGGAGSPTPITSAAGINNPTVTGGTPTYAQILAFPGDILADSAAAAGQKWAISAATWAKLAATYNDGTTKSYPVLDTVTKTIIGYPYEVSENVGTNAAFFGDWSKVVIGTWGNGIELNTDTATLSLAGGVRIVGLQLVDFAVRHGKALAYSTGVAA